MLDSAVATLEKELLALKSRAPGLAESTLAAGAMAMARELDKPHNSATSKSMCQARLQDALRELRELAPPEEKKDALDEVGKRRAERRARQAAAADQAGS